MGMARLADDRPGRSVKLLAYFRADSGRIDDKRHFALSSFSSLFYFLNLMV